MKTPRAGFGAFVLVMLACAVSGCQRHHEQVTTVSKPPEPPPSSSPGPASPNAAILDEVNRLGAWFRAKKVRPIRARKLEQDETVQSLEGPVQAKAGDYLCRGEAGEPWPQSAKSLHERYLETDEIDAEGWRRFTPRPDAEGVLAAKIDHPFKVQATWGPLAGKAGDYLIKRYVDRDVPAPVDVWIVDATLFLATYAAVDDDSETTKKSPE
jgi:hypothetical protein